jgi:predicted deacylase
MPGLVPEIAVYRFGEPGQGPKIYIQGGLHADEGPGSLVAHHLVSLLSVLRPEAFLGEIVIVPVANPIGLGQRLLGSTIGRFSFEDGRNFNRHYPDLAAAAVAALGDQLTSSGAENRRTIQRNLRELARAIQPSDAVQRLKAELLALAIDADFVLDLHCDTEAEMHFYTLPALLGPLMPLFQRMGAVAVLTADASGDHPFDEAVSVPWMAIRQAFPQWPVPQGGVATTVELRGQGDTGPEFHEADALAVLDFLRFKGFLAGAIPDLPAPTCNPTPLDACALIPAPASGLLAWLRPLGAHLTQGEPLACIIDPVTRAETIVPAETSGRLFARTNTRQVAVGQRLGKIAGSVPLRAGILLGP